MSRKKNTKTNPNENNKEKSQKIKVALVLNELRGVAGKDYSAGTVVMTGELKIKGMTADDLNRGFAIKQITAQEA